MTEIVFLGLNDIGQRLYEWLVDREDANVRALVTEPDQLDLVKELEPELILSAGFRAIVPEDILAVPENGAVNAHKSYLPHHRGANPNVWSIIDEPPAGVSLHYMTSDVDAGPIIDRRTVPLYPDDDGRELYERLENAQFKQFIEVWPEIRDGTADTTEQDPEAGSYHYKKEFVDLWEIDLEEPVRAGDFIDRLRALTFEPYKNAYFEIEGQRYWVEITITPESESNSTDESAPEKNVPRYSTDGEQ